jgi:hypothetical protein
MPNFTKQMVWELFAEDAKSFALYCHQGIYNSTDPSVDDDQKALAFMFTQYEAVTLGTYLLNSYALPTLLAKGVIGQATVDRIMEYVSG